MSSKFAVSVVRVGISTGVVTEQYLHGQMRHSQGFAAVTVQ